MKLACPEIHHLVSSECLKKVSCVVEVDGGLGSEAESWAHTAVEKMARHTNSTTKHSDFDRQTPAIATHETRRIGRDFLTCFLAARTGRACARTYCFSLTRHCYGRVPPLHAWTDLNPQSP